MLLSTGIIGIGNMGNMVAALAAANKQMPVIGLNTSEQDLDAVKSSTAIDCLFMGGNGAGKDRTKSKDYMKQFIKSLLGDDKFKKFIDQVDVIFIVSSTGGGTGSGTSPMLADILRNLYKDKIVILIGTLPTIGESIGAQRNTIEYLTEVVRLNIPYILFDNQNASGTTNEVFDKVNKDVVDTVSVIRGDYNRISPYGMIDTADMKKLVTLPGLIHVNILNGIYLEKIPTDGTIEDLVLDSIKSNTMVTVDRDKIVKRRGYIVNLSEDVQPYFNKDLPEITKQYGEPLEVFDHFAINNDDESQNFVIIIQSGLSLPENRLKAIQHRIQAAEEALKKQKQSSILDELAKSVDVYNVTTDSKDDHQKDDFDLNSIMSKY